jgi:hypothetical protein
LAAADGALLLAGVALAAGSYSKQKATTMEALMTQLGRRARLTAHRSAHLLAMVAALAALTTPSARAANAAAPGPSPLQSTARGSGVAPSSSAPAASGGSLEAAASKASKLGRKVAMSLIALGLAVAAVVLVFRRDFRDAARVLVVGLLAMLLATSAGVSVLRGTVTFLFGA